MKFSPQEIILVRSSQAIYLLLGVGISPVATEGSGESRRHLKVVWLFVDFIFYCFLNSFFSFF